MELRDRCSEYVDTGDERRFDEEYQAQRSKLGFGWDQYDPGWIE